VEDEAMTSFQALLQGYFVERLARQRSASDHTIGAYRDTFRLLLRFATRAIGKLPSRLAMEDLDAPFISRFLDHLEQDRGNGSRTRNARLAAIHGFFHYVALTEPSYALHCQRVLAIPSKRFERKTIEFLVPEEIDAILAAPDCSTWIGRRDRTLLLVAVQTGLRVSELIGLRGGHVVLGNGAHVRCLGKGRKERSTPLRPDVARALRAWLHHDRDDDSQQIVFASSRGGALSRDAVERIVRRHVAVAARACPSLKRKRVTPHTLRHSAAMELLRAGVDRSVIALWLGHESMETTQMYLHADMRLKEQAMARTASTRSPRTRYRPEDRLLAFLEDL
jgi:integrase/recombinase XerD